MTGSAARAEPFGLRRRFARALIVIGALALARSTEGEHVGAVGR
jgi:hypothetical protein